MTCILDQEENRFTGLIQRLVKSACYRETTTLCHYISWKNPLLSIEGYILHSNIS